MPTGIFRTFRSPPPAPPGEMAVEAAVDARDLDPLFDDFAGRLLCLTPPDPRAELRTRFEEAGAVKVVWRDARGQIVGAALGAVEGAGCDIVFLPVMPAVADVASTARLLEALLGALPPSVLRVRAMDRMAHRWLHLPSADSRGILDRRGFAAFDRVLLSRDLKRALPAPPPLPPGFQLTTPDPRRVEEFADFAFRAYRGTTDFAIIAPEASPAAYARLYRKFLSGELGEYAPPLSMALLAPDSSLAGVLHTILVAREPYVGDLSVLTEHRRHHLGRALLCTALQRYRDAGLTRAALTVTAQNTAAYNLYRSVGFEVERSGEVFLLAR